MLDDSVRRTTVTDLVPDSDDEDDIVVDVEIARTPTGKPETLKGWYTVKKKVLGTLETHEEEGMRAEMHRVVAAPDGKYHEFDPDDEAAVERAESGLKRIAKFWTKAAPEEGDPQGKQTLLHAIDKFLGVSKPPAIEYLFVEYMVPRGCKARHPRARCTDTRSALR